MKTSQVVAIICMTGALIAFSGVPSGAQHSSGGTSPSVTEGKTGSQGSEESQGTQGEPGSGQNSQQGGSGSGLGEANPPESSKGTGYGLESGSHSERDYESGGHMGSGGTSGSGSKGSGGTSGSGTGPGGSGSGGSGGGR